MTGFIVDSETEAIEAVGLNRDLDRRGVRDTFERRFTARRMAEDYLAHYRQLVNVNATPLDTPLVPDSNVVS